MGRKNKSLLDRETFTAFFPLLAVTGQRRLRTYRRMCMCERARFSRRYTRRLESLQGQRGALRRTLKVTGAQETLPNGDYQTA